MYKEQSFNPRKLAMCDLSRDDVKTLAKNDFDTALMNLSLICRYTIVSTGGTASALEGNGVSVTRVEELTGFPEMVKTVYIIHLNTFFC